jgi:hypothetical protein
MTMNSEPMLFEYRPTGFERVEATIKPMPDIPADANPFHHDDFSMGTALSRRWIIMHPGFDSKEHPEAMQWMYLVNTRTGQRIRIDLAHKPTDEQVEQQRKDWEATLASYEDNDSTNSTGED